MGKRKKKRRQPKLLPPPPPLTVHPIKNREALERTIECYRCTDCKRKFVGRAGPEQILPNGDRVPTRCIYCGCLYVLWCSFKWPEPFTVRPVGWPRQ